MRFSISVLVLAIGAAYCTANSARADDASELAARRAARYDLEVAKLELRQYWQVDYPRQQRHLDAAIEMTEAEIRDHRERLRMYQPFDRFSIGAPFPLTLQELRMCIRDAELRLHDLCEERAALIRFHPAHWRMLEQRVNEARLRVAELELDDRNGDSVAQSVR